MNTSTADTDWTTEHRQVLDFGRILTAADALTTAAEAIEYLEKPSSFDPQHNLWTRSGRPYPPSSDDLTEARTLGPTSPRATALRQQHHTTSTAWNAFRALLNEYDHTGRPIQLADQP